MDFPPANPLPEMRGEGRTRQEGLHWQKKISKFPTRSFSLYPVQCNNDAEPLQHKRKKKFWLVVFLTVYWERIITRGRVRGQVEWLFWLIISCEGPTGSSLARALNISRTRIFKEDSTFLLWFFPPHNPLEANIVKTSTCHTKRRKTKRVGRKEDMVEEISTTIKKAWSSFTLRFLWH